MGKQVIKVRMLDQESEYDAPPENRSIIGNQRAMQAQASRLFDRRVVNPRFNTSDRTLIATDAATGKLIKMDLGVADVHIDSIVPAYAAGYQLQDSYADKVAPPLLVPKASDKFPTWDADNAFQQVDSLQAGPGGQLPEVGFTLSKNPFATVQYVLSTFVQTEVDANADGALRPTIAGIKRIMNAMRLARENRVITLVTTAANWGTSQQLALAAAAKWNGGGSSDPVANIDQMMENSLQPVTSMIMNKRVFNTFRRNAQVQKFIQFKPDVPGVPDESRINGQQALLNLPKNIYVSQMKVKTSATAYDYLWPDSVVLFREFDGAPTSQEDIATAKTFRWNGGNGAVQDKVARFEDESGGGLIFNGWVFRQFWDRRRGLRGGMLSILGVNDDEKMTSVNAGGTTSIVGGLITGCLQ